MWHIYIYTEKTEVCDKISEKYFLECRSQWRWVFFETTRRNNPEDSNLYTHRSENLQNLAYIILAYFP
jgi:hypothetical protein